MSRRHGTLRMRRALALLVAAPVLAVGTGYLATNTVPPSHAGVVEVPVTITATPTTAPAAQAAQTGGDGRAGSTGGATAPPPTTASTDTATSRTTPPSTTSASDTATDRTNLSPTTPPRGTAGSPAE